jgi:hypothetical protein
MKTIYIDSDFKCHVTNNTGTYIAIETNLFDGKCDTYIEGYRFVPKGENWTRSDGEVFHGEMIAPWTDHRELDVAQREYEQKLLKQYETELAELDAVLLDMQYQSLVEGL